ncbi:MAG: flagellin FliC5 [Lachnospiraceae bacterium]|nr:flagellin FliC5 [Lachnospiraceae bacterium]
MSISGVGSGYTDYSSYGKLASGKALQTAADGAAELAIAEKEESQARGLDKGTQNAETAKDMLRVTDGAQASITDYLQRIRELAIDASSGLKTDSDKEKIQVEVDQLKQGIADVAKQTQFNTKNILDGTETGFNIATDANGNGKTVTTGDATLEALGIKDFDVTKDYDLNVIDSALEKITTDRAAGGAQYNTLESTINYNNYASQNTTASQSRLEDLDMPKAISEQKKNQLLDTYQTMMQKKQMEDKENQNRLLFS